MIINITIGKIPFYLIKSAFRPNMKFHSNFDFEVPEVVFFPLYYKEVLLSWKNNLLFPAAVSFVFLPLPIWYYKKWKLTIIIDQLKLGISWNEISFYCIIFLIWNLSLKHRLKKKTSPSMMCFISYGDKPQSYFLILWRIFS